MNENTFWDIIEMSKQTKYGIDMNNQSDALIEILIQKDIKTIFEFENYLQKLQKQLDTAHLSALAATKLDVSLPSKHTQQGFSNWIICLGKETYQKALENPLSILKINDEKRLVNGRAYLPELNQVASCTFYELKGLDADWVKEFSDYNTTKKRHKDIQTNTINKSRGMDL